jgi:methylated-DNA-[protein]-cysteine S-methyltransferase
METAFVKNNFTAKIVGDESGIAIMFRTKEASVLIPKFYRNVQIEAYFEGKRNYFSFKMNPKGTNKVWKALLDILEN